jgi:putative protease
MPFLTAAQLNDLRRSVLNKLEECIVKNYVRTERKPAESVVDYPEKTLDFRANVVNKLSENFYRQRGVTEIQPGYELLEDNVGAVVMTSRYCIRRECGMCLKNPKTKYRGKLFIENNFHTFELKFDCANCEMSLVYGGSRKN